MSQLNEEQVATLRDVQHYRYEALADLGVEGDTSTQADVEWADKVDSLLGIIDHLTGGRREVLVELYFDAEVSSATASSLLYGLGNEGLEFTAHPINAKLFELRGEVPVRVDVAASIRKVAETTALFLLTEQSAKSSIKRVIEHLSGINVVDFGPRR